MSTEAPPIPDADGYEPNPNGHSRDCAPRPLRESAEESIQCFLSQLDGAPASELYHLVMAQVEEPLLAAVMQFTNGNQSRASDMLGLNRGTLRKKLRQYGLIELADNRPPPGKSTGSQS